MKSPSKDRGRAEFEALLHQFVERKIELRAYELYEERGRSDGHALDDWVKAEAEILGKPPLAAVAKTRGQLYELNEHPSPHVSAEYTTYGSGGKRRSRF